jgi:hypothetical protein
MVGLEVEKWEERFDRRVDATTVLEGLKWDRDRKV